MKGLAEKSNMRTLIDSIQPQSDVESFFCATVKPFEAAAVQVPISG